MKKLLFMMFLLGGISFGFTSCGGEEEGGEETTESTGEGAEEEAH